MAKSLGEMLLLHEPSGATPKPGLYHYFHEVSGGEARFHLRVDPDGGGLLIANASAGVRLSPTGTAVAKAILDGGDDVPIAKKLSRSFYGAKTDRMLHDVRRVRAVIDELPDPSGRYPMSTLDDATASVHRRRLWAPLSADVVTPEVGPHLSLLPKLWEIGIPQVSFVLPAGTPGTHLPRLVEKAEDLGLIAGVRARASDLMTPGLFEELARAGVDHVDLTYLGPDAESHDDLFELGDHANAEALVERAHALEVCPVLVVPAMTTTLDEIDALEVRLRELQVGAITVFAVVREGADEGRVLGSDSLPMMAAAFEELADADDINLVWAPPVERDAAVSLGDQARQGPRTTGEGGIHVEADGDVVAPEGPVTPAGNLLRDEWSSIWEHPVFAHYRESVDDPARCDTCPGLLACQAGCPGDPDTWAWSRDTGKAGL